MKNKKEEIENIIGDYKQGFKTDIKNYFELEPGLSREKIKIISEMKSLGIFDKTLFVVYGDHEAYYQKLSKKITKSACLILTSYVRE